MLKIITLVKELLGIRSLFYLQAIFAIASNNEIDREDTKYLKWDDIHSGICFHCIEAMLEL